MIGNAQLAPPARGQHDKLASISGPCGPKDFRANLMELTVSALSADSRGGTSAPRTRVSDCSDCTADHVRFAHAAARRSFRTQRQAIASFAVFEGRYIFNHVGHFADRAFRITGSALQSANRIRCNRRLPGSTCFSGPSMRCQESGFRPADNRSCRWLECSWPRLFSLYIK